jgi:hypothetical protein
MQQAVATLAGLNGMQVPQFIIADETGLVAERAARDAALLPVLQASGLKLTQNYFEDRYDFHAQDLEAVETPDPDPALQPGPTAQPEPANPGPAEAAEAEASASLVTLKRYTKVQQEIEDLGDAAMEEAPLPIDPVLLRDAILGATSQEDLQERLAVVWEGGPDARFVETLEKAAFMARVIGYVSAERRES